MGNTVSTLGGAMESEVTRSYNSLSGTDIRAVIGHLTFAEIQAISYSIHRKKAPIYTMDSPDPRAFSRAKRGVAGSLIWINFDRHALLNLVRTAGGQFVANKDDIRPEFQVAKDGFIGQAVIFNASVNRDSAVPVSATIDQLDTQLSSVSGFKESAVPWYSDQILPFDVTLAGTSELGAAATMKIFGGDWAILNMVSPSTRAVWSGSHSAAARRVMTQLKPAPEAAAAGPAGWLESASQKEQDCAQAGTGRISCSPQD